MKLFFNAVFCLLILASLTPSHGYAQGYYVILEGTQARLYLGYVNPVRFSIQNHSDAVQYNFHAQAEGAIIDYDNRGSMLIKPLVKNGEIRFFAERGGVIFNVKGVFQFEGVEPPPLTDGTFVQMMGITKGDPKTSIKSPKKFALPVKQKVQDSNLEIGGIPLSDLRNDKQNIVKILIMKREGATGVRQIGDIQIESKDAGIQKIDPGTFSISPNPNIKRCKLTIFLDGRKISDEVVSVWAPN